MFLAIASVSILLAFQTVSVQSVESVDSPSELVFATLWWMSRSLVGQFQFPTMPPGIELPSVAPGVPFPISPQCVEKMQNFFQSHVLESLSCSIIIQGAKESKRMPDMKTLCDSCGNLLTGLLETLKSSDVCIKGEFLRLYLSRLSCAQAFEIVDLTRSMVCYGYTA